MSIVLNTREVSTSVHSIVIEDNATSEPSTVSPESISLSWKKEKSDKPETAVATGSATNPGVFAIRYSVKEEGNHEFTLSLNGQTVLKEEINVYSKTFACVQCGVSLKVGENCSGHQTKSHTPKCYDCAEKSSEFKRKSEKEAKEKRKLVKRTMSHDTNSNTTQKNEESKHQSADHSEDDSEHQEESPTPKRAMKRTRKRRQSAKKSTTIVSSSGKVHFSTPGSTPSSPPSSTPSSTPSSSSSSPSHPTPSSSLSANPDRARERAKSANEDLEIRVAEQARDHAKTVSELEHRLAEQSRSHAKVIEELELRVAEQAKNHVKIVSELEKKASEIELMMMERLKQAELEWEKKFKQEKEEKETLFTKHQKLQQEFSELGDLYEQSIQQEAEFTQQHDTLVEKHEVVQKLLEEKDAEIEKLYSERRTLQEKLEATSVKQSSTDSQDDLVAKYKHLEQQYQKSIRLAAKQKKRIEELEGKGSNAATISSSDAPASPKKSPSQPATPTPQPPTTEVPQPVSPPEESDPPKQSVKQQNLPDEQDAFRQRLETATISFINAAGGNAEAFLKKELCVQCLKSLLEKRMSVVKLRTSVNKLYWHYADGKTGQIALKPFLELFDALWEAKD